MTEKKEKPFSAEEADDREYWREGWEPPKPPDLSWVEEEEREKKKKQKAAAAQAKEKESNAGGHGGGENSTGGHSSVSGGHSQNANAQGGAGGHGSSGGHSAGGGGGWGGKAGKSGMGNVVIAEPDIAAHSQAHDQQHQHKPYEEIRESRAPSQPVPAKKPLAYKLKDADPLAGVYSERMKDKIKKEAASGATETAKDTEILKLAQPIDSDDRWLIEKSFSKQFLNSRLNAGHTLPSSMYSREAIDQRISELNRETKPAENQNQVAAKSMFDPGNDQTKDLPVVRSVGADASASASLAPQTRADAAPPAAPAPVPRARDSGREM